MFVFLPGRTGLLTAPNARCTQRLLPANDEPNLPRPPDSTRSITSTTQPSRSLASPPKSSSLHQISLSNYIKSLEGGVQPAVEGKVEGAEAIRIQAAIRGRRGRKSIVGLRRRSWLGCFLRLLLLLLLRFRFSFSFFGFAWSTQ